MGSSGGAILVADFVPGDYGSAGNSAVGDTAAGGSAGTISRSDHKHGREAFATPSVALGAAAAAGAATTPIRSDSTIAAFDATAPSTQAFGDSPATGAAAVAARRDHKHGIPANTLPQAYIDTLGKAVVSGQDGNPTLFDPASTVYTDGARAEIVWGPPGFYSLELYGISGKCYSATTFNEPNNRNLSTDLSAGNDAGTHNAELYSYVQASPAESVGADCQAYQAITCDNGGVTTVAQLDFCRHNVRAQSGQTEPLYQGEDENGAGVYSVSPAGVLSEKGLATSAITSGALPIVVPVSGTAFQCSTVRDVELHVPVTFNPTGLAAATCLVELSPDNVTFSPLATETVPVGVAFDGTIRDVKLTVPAGFWPRYTVTNAVLGTGTYY